MNERPNRRREERGSRVRDERDVYKRQVMPGMVYISFPTEGGTSYSAVSSALEYMVPPSVGKEIYTIPGMTMCS